MILLTNAIFFIPCAPAPWCFLDRRLVMPSEGSLVTSLLVGAQSVSRLAAMDLENVSPLDWLQAEGGSGPFLSGGAESTQSLLLRTTLQRFGGVNQHLLLGLEEKVHQWISVYFWSLMHFAFCLFLSFLMYDSINWQRHECVMEKYWKGSIIFQFIFT